ncbi:FAD-dependent oxidoreductase [Haloferax mediterranei ATCC 33500]|uniref:FAD-dependent oxidoreductase n=1 Tax=Haloferax mediterranei (strain ATCC 33500 / DSM 1411 / JCM 8866 / NBRC 14739 / NCIMB 2177 / R-4) TaxID=523841 RepID=I3R6V9_HALMT|nr:FAD-dependent oxidoreductase [Haloferax mediterranei]AFK19969.1 NAD/FAD-dependent oxidoreductase [Haloferax mediterranei ATCC 33500]AHZ23346.1 NAD/FAD-dependent oxidoreductase [Haloferax mediterranei ATCC 33500]ELZ99514.1 NAD/FAD-dependent oxidoreductase [Haloferax mediterranei ATCC 33500]MDX5987280.1 FAD-dependent oxidoreductase [Haloferax mediterranei ATCC 33500]QCQ73801.1 FAD-dependent oxidoreductase [Haloferax mediterranei ATCC 33500]
MTRDVCIVGAGAAGAGAAYALRDTNSNVTILEKSRGVCGRAATRRKNGCRYDHGANYIKNHDQRTTQLIRDLGEDGLVDVEKPVWTFDGDGVISTGDARDQYKWSWTEGITQLAKRLLAQTDAAVERETQVAAIDHNPDTGYWSVVDATGTRRGPFDVVLLTPPAPQTAAILTETGWGNQCMVGLREAIGSVEYRTIRTIVLHYPFEREEPWYALVNTDKEHDIGWVAREECKDGHVPDGESLLVVQLSPEWSTEHYDDPLSEVAPDVADMVAALLDDDRLRDPDWVDDQGWRYALPNGVANREIIRRGEPNGLYFAGDWTVGEGRVHAALWSGIEAGERIANG